MLRRFLSLVIVPCVLACENDPRARALEDPDPDAGADAAAPAEGGPDTGDASDGAAAAYPARLSLTGLFTTVSPETLAAGVTPFRPKYELWSDGAAKRRWISLPAGQQIDTSNMDFWRYPVGTKVWKEFTSGSTRVETRMLHKSGPAKSDWVMIAYRWRSDQTDADAVPGGVNDASSTGHDIPDQDTCHTCHDSMQDVLLGVTALQLSHSFPGLTLSSLATSGALTVNPPSAGFTIPGGTVAETALGYLHANCGMCHNARGPTAITIAMNWWESTSSLSTLESTTGYTTGVGQPTAFQSLDAIEPGSPSTSAIIVRMSSRTGIQMPPVGTEQVDTAGVAAVTAFIDSLPPTVTDAGPEGGALDGG